MEAFNQNKVWILALAMLWTIPWKGYALWTASKTSNKRWFIALIVLNTFALLDIFYIFYVAKKTPRDIINAFKGKL